MHLKLSPIAALLALSITTSALVTPASPLPAPSSSLALRQEAEIAELTVEIIIDVAKEVVDLIKGINQLVHQADAETQYTQSTLSQLSAKYPNKNVLIYSDRTSASRLAGAVCGDHELDIGLGFTKGYRLCVFDSGSFDRSGDGGFINWAFTGNYKRADGSPHVDFFPIGAQLPSRLRIKRDTGLPAITYDWASHPGSNRTHIPLQPPFTYTPPVLSSPMLPPSQPSCVKPVDDGNYLVSCHAANGTTALGVAYYKAVVPHGGNKGQQPDDFALLVETTPKTAPAYGSATGSNSSAATPHEGWRFSTGAMQFEDSKATFHWSIFGDAISETVTVDETAGFANNGEDFFWVYKDDGLELFSHEGWSCDSLYYAL